MGSRQKVIGIDARFFSYHERGLGRYVWHLIDGLAKSSSTNHYIVFLRKQAFALWNPSSPKITKVLADIPWYTFKEQYYYPGSIKKYTPDLMHFPHYNVPLGYRGPYVVTIHDLLLNRYPTSNASTRHPLIFLAKYAGYRYIMRKTLRRARAIIAVSHFTEDELVHYYPYTKEKITVVYEGIEHVRAQPSQTGTINVPKPFILYVGAAYPHKNLKRTVVVLAQYLRRNSMFFVLVGKKDYFYERFYTWIREKNYTDVVYCAGEVTDRELVSYYKNAEVCIMPSRYEGFGLPPLEALASGCPVVASSAGSLPEVLGDAALFYNVTESSILPKLIHRVRTDSALKHDLLQKGNKRIQRYSWKTMVCETETVYNTIDAGKKRTYEP